jgi:hypothetical protein
MRVPSTRHCRNRAVGKELVPRGVEVASVVSEPETGHYMAGFSGMMDFGGT